MLVAGAAGFGAGLVVGRGTADDDPAEEAVAARQEPTTTIEDEAPADDDTVASPYETDPGLPDDEASDDEPSDEELAAIDPEDGWEEEPLPGEVPRETQPIAPGQLTHTLTVHDDGCGVIRTAVDPEPDGLTWSVYDEDGFSVLGRNALGETRYRYFTPGTYTMVLEAWGGDGYVPVSNEVTITC